METLALNLAQSSVRIALLNAGEGSTLASAGIPAVIGFHKAITDRASIAFSRAFYTTLAASNPVDNAVTNGRLSILNQTGNDEYFWGSPVFYSRTDYSTIFPIRSKHHRASDRELTVPSHLTLRDMLVKHFNKDELELLYADITDALNRDGIPQTVDLEIVGGNSLETYALNLIQHLERRGLVNYLMKAATAERPNLLQTNMD